MIDSRQFRKIEKRDVDPKLEKLGFASRKSKWGGRLFVRRYENQLHGIRVDLSWPTFSVKHFWHYDFIPSVEFGETSGKRDADKPFDVNDFVVGKYVESGSRWYWEIGEDEAELEAFLHEAIGLAIVALDCLSQRFRDPRELLQRLPPHVFRYRVYDIDGSDKTTGDVGQSLLSWILGCDPFRENRVLLEFLRLLAEHVGNKTLATDYVHVREDLSRWYQLIRSTDRLPTERILPVINAKFADSEAPQKSQE